MSLDAFFRQIDTISREGSNFLDVTEVPMLRGMPRNDEFLVKSVRQNRTPTIGQTTNDSEFRRFIYNTMVQKETGIANLRQQSVFTIGSVQEASMYGNAFVVFPINGTRYMISESSDSMSLLAGLFNELKKEFEDQLVKQVMNPDADLSSVVRRFYQNGNEDVFRLDIEWTDRVERIDALGAQGYEALENAIASTMTSSVWQTNRPVEIRVSDLNSALRQDYEIMMFDAPYYYAVSYDLMLEGMGEGFLNSTEEAYDNLLNIIDEGL